MNLTKLFSVISFLSIVFIENAFAHDTPVHQYIVKQAYYFLENEIGTIPELRDRIGLSFSGSGDDNHPWNTGYIGVAAMREDMDDPIWGFGGLFNGWTPTVTHFRNADEGDNGKIAIPGAGPLTIPIVTVGNVNTYNPLEYDPTPFPALPWRGDQIISGSQSRSAFSSLSEKFSSIKNTNTNISSNILNVVNAKFDSAMRQRSKEEVLLSLAANYRAKGKYRKAKDIFESIVKGNNRTKSDMPALIQLYGTYQEELFDSLSSLQLKRTEQKEAFKQKLLNISVYNSNKNIN